MNLRRKLNVGLLKIVLVSCVLITSIPLGMSNSQIFWNQPFRGALANRKSTYFGRGSYDGCFCIKMFLLTLFFVFLIVSKKKCKTKICFTIVKFNVFDPFCSQCTLSIPPENIRKLKCSLVFPGGRGRVTWDWF